MSTLQLDGVSLHYEEAGQGIPVLLLHGLGSSGGDWEWVIPRLANGYRLIVPDARGHGRSSKPPGAYGVPLFARDIAGLCDALGLTRVHVVGLSMGGMMGFQLALDRPDLVRSLVIVNSGPEVVARTLKRKFEFTVRRVLLRLLGPKGLAKMLAPRLFPKPEQAALRERVLTGISANDPDAYRRATLGLLGWSVMARLPDIRCPVLAVHSERDYTPLSAKQAYVDLLPHARLHVLTDSGHAAPLDQPGPLTDAVEDFLRTVDAGSAQDSALGA
ncbi:alpha/beta fold family hydrolase [Myxococcus stipitatus DSM 14675]|uniref:Alpha/beta fold family hydrolase n=1 Tax=Myxococcus stipitatus (strain DSM 14675 / JCM 12634 / Mx s8) TaxID=1278073 RepID=L7UNU1_MYXSD|nr:alpha/beta hydrolase [Myxococcus stipitatus]AGC49242.1 alpha/beta fold family hydrolase [Myxococcus stipitatus DSM 14675]